MRRLYFFVLLLVASAAYAQVPKAESLGTVARKARAQHETPRAVRVYTEDDLARLRLLPINIIGEIAEESELPRESDRETPEAKWRRRFTDTRREVAQAEARVAQMQRAFDREAAKAALTMDWSVLTCGTNSQVLAPGYSGAALLTEICAAINESKTALQQARLKLAGLDDELRRAGGYPGWARE